MRLRLLIISLIGIGAIACTHIAFRTSKVSPKKNPISIDAAANDSFDWSDLTIDRNLILSGGVGVDQIPALSNPKVTTTQSVDFLSDADRIVAVTIDTQTRLYPIRLLNWHEVVNDTLADRPIAVVYCPLCDSVSVIDRRINDETLTFGVSGLLYNSNVLLYDRTHHALWSQLQLSAISGPYAGIKLSHLPFEIIRFRTAKEEYPDSETLTLETGHARDYSRNPYANYFKHDHLMFDVSHESKEINTKEAVIGILTPDPIAIPISIIQAAPNRRIHIKTEVGPLTLTANPNTGDIRILEIPSDYEAVHTFWFAWYAMHPNTDILTK